MAFRALSVVSDFRKALWLAIQDAEDAGLEQDQIEDIVRDELHRFVFNELPKIDSETG